MIASEYPLLMFCALSTASLSSVLRMRRLSQRSAPPGVSEVLLSERSKTRKPTSSSKVRIWYDREGWDMPRLRAAWLKLRVRASSSTQATCLSFI